MARPLRPASRLGWWAFWLGLASVAWGLLFRLVTQVARRALEAGAHGPAPLARAPNGVLVELSLAVAAIVVGAIALRKGERSWLGLAAFIPAALIGGFWVLFALGEVLFPH